MVTVRVNPYSQVMFETNRYSVPVAKAHREVTLKAYPFVIDLFDERGTLRVTGLMFILEYMTLSLFYLFPPYPNFACISVLDLNKPRHY